MTEERLREIERKLHRRTNSELTNVPLYDPWEGDVRELIAEVRRLQAELHGNWRVENNADGTSARVYLNDRLVETITLAPRPAL